MKQHVLMLCCVAMSEWIMVKDISYEMLALVVKKSTSIYTEAAMMPAFSISGNEH